MSGNAKPRARAMAHRNGRRTTEKQAEILNADLGYDDGGRYAVVAVSGYTIAEGAGTDAFGTVFSLIDTASGDEAEVSALVPSAEARNERRHWIARARHLNGKDEAL